MAIVARFVVCVVDRWPGDLSCGVAFSGGHCLLDSGGLSKPACGETQEEQLGVARGIWNSPERVDLASCCKSLVERVSESLTSIDFDDDGASCDAASARVVQLSELKWQQNLDLPMRCEQSTI